MRLRRIVRLGNDDGDALIELAFGLPVLLALVVGITFGGITFYDYVTLADAVAAGARTLATSRTNGPPYRSRAQRRKTCSRVPPLT